MQICGFQKTTLLDFPSHLAATIFLGGCNFNCNFCHNYELIHSPFSETVYNPDEILSYLTKRKSILEGVCITGGEPTIHSDLFDFISQIKELGFLVKLDTNGTNPELVKNLYQNNMIDYVAMDIKSGITNYAPVSGLKAGSDSILNNIQETIHFLIHETDPSRFSYEFRTTVVKPLHSKSDFEEIKHMISGAKNYYLQNFRKCSNPLSSSFQPFTTEELNEFVHIVEDFVDYVAIRNDN